MSKPWEIPIDFIKNYYGEKIAFYFSFLGYNCKRLIYMAVLGLIV